MHEMASNSVERILSNFSSVEFVSSAFICSCSGRVAASCSQSVFPPHRPPCSPPDPQSCPHPSIRQCNLAYGNRHLSTRLPSNSRASLAPSSEITDKSRRLLCNHLPQFTVARPKNVFILQVVLPRALPAERSQRNAAAIPQWYPKQTNSQFKG